MASVRNCNVLPEFICDGQRDLETPQFTVGSVIHGKMENSFRST